MTTNQDGDLMDLTPESILSDIAGYQGRIDTAAAELGKLPAGKVCCFRLQKVVDKKRREFISEIEHNARLLRYAEESLHGLELINEYSQ